MDVVDKLDFPNNARGPSAVMKDRQRTQGKEGPNKAYRIPVAKTKPSATRFPFEICNVVSIGIGNKIKIVSVAMLIAPTAMFSLIVLTHWFLSI